MSAATAMASRPGSATSSNRNVVLRQDSCNYLVYVFHLFYMYGTTSSGVTITSKQKKVLLRKQMKLALPECNIPPRLLLGIQNSRSILYACARHRVSYALGFLLVTTLVLFVSYLRTRSKPENTFKVPLWLCFIPAAFWLIYAAQSSYSVDRDTSTDAIEFQLSGMSKKDFLNYKVGDDRASKAFAASATSAGLLSGTNLLGPFLRADR